jgi:hypothetical protein
MTIVRGYLQPGRNIVSIRIPCPDCKTWHSHGDGSLADKRTPVGDLTHRVGHCYDKDRFPGGYYIQIQPERFQKQWETGRGRISKTYSNNTTVGTAFA